MAGGDDPAPSAMQLKHPLLRHKPGCPDSTRSHVDPGNILSDRVRLFRTMPVTYARDARPLSAA